MPIHVAGRLRVVSVLALICVAASCAPRLDEQHVRTRLVEQLRLQNEPLRIRAIAGGSQPVATIDYGGAVAEIRFRWQDGVWVIDAVGREGRWEAADTAVPRLARELTEKARARSLADVMPKYARTLKQLVGWSSLLNAGCGAGLPLSRSALLNLHATWHRVLFVNRPGEYHNGDLFMRDAWWRELKVGYSPTRVDVQSAGADGKMDTPDDVRISFTRSPVRPGVTVCMPHFTVPAFVADAIGRAEAPTEWNCSDLMTALKRSEQLELAGR